MQFMDIWFCFPSNMKLHILPQRSNWLLRIFHSPSCVRGACGGLSDWAYFFSLICYNENKQVTNTRTSCASRFRIRWSVSIKSIKGRVELLEWREKIWNDLNVLCVPCCLFVILKQFPSLFFFQHADVWAWAAPTNADSLLSLTPSFVTVYLCKCKA